MVAKKYRVVREHGDFREGDIRTAEPADVQHLVPHCLEPVSVKRAPAHKNKAETPQANKGGDA